MEILMERIKKMARPRNKKAKLTDTVMPFTENPAIEPASKDMLSAEVLFSMFTANIIKQRIRFT
jgi:hypothetical protein